MFQTMLPVNDNINVGQWPPSVEQEMNDLCAVKRMMKGKDIEQETRRRKSSVLQTTNEWSNESPVPHEYNPLNEPCLLGLKLKKTPSALELLEARLSEARVAQKKKDPKTRPRAKARAQASQPIDNKASNFPAIILRIGKWEYASKHAGDLTAKIYFGKHKIIWEILEGGLKYKIEFEWEAIMGLKAHCLVDGPDTLSIAVFTLSHLYIYYLSKKPQFFREINPQPRKHTIWQATADFTDGEASGYRTHYLQCAPGVLDKHYEKLMKCDTRLNFLSQQASEGYVKDSNALNNKDSGTVCRDLFKQHGQVEGWGIAGSKADELVNATTFVLDIVASTKIPARVNEVNQNQLVVNGSRINSLCGIVWDENESNGCTNFYGQEWVDGNDGFTPWDNPTPENENVGMSKADSLTDLLNILPQIESLPRLFFENSQEDDIMDF